MVAMFPEYKIASDYSNQDDLESFSTLVTSTPDEWLDAPSSFAKWRKGLRKTRGNGRDLWLGYESFTWKVSRCTEARFIYLHDTLLSASLDGEVTVQTLKGGVGSTYAIYNAILKLPELPDLNNPPGTKIFLDFVMTFIKVRYIEDAS